MDYIEQVQCGIDYIEAHLEVEIELSAVAQAAGISQWHFQRIFKGLTNETLKSYIRARRFAYALEKLIATNERILDIALGAGFETQESFTRAFKQTFNMTPNAYRKLGKNKLFLKKIRVDVSYLEHINQNISHEPEFYRQHQLSLVGLRTLFFSVDSEKNNIAEQLPPLWNNFLNRLHEINHRVAGPCYGVVQSTGFNSDQLEYFAAVEVASIDPVPEGMQLITIPAAGYAKFTHRGASNQLNNTVNYIYSNWLLRSRTRHTYGPDLEIYGPDYHPTSSQSMIHYAIPVE